MRSPALPDQKDLPPAGLNPNTSAQNEEHLTSYINTCINREIGWNRPTSGVHRTQARCWRCLNRNGWKEHSKPRDPRPPQNILTDREMTLRFDLTSEIT